MSNEKRLKISMKIKGQRDGESKTKEVEEDEFSRVKKLKVFSVKKNKNFNMIHEEKKNGKFLSVLSI
jgi:hypothetical protein